MDENGDSIIVEVDRSKYFHRKYHRGKWREGHLVFGAVEAQQECCMVEVPDRSAAKLQHITQWI